MILTIQIEVDEQKYKEAIVKGWAERYDEKLPIDEITRLDLFHDFKLALSVLELDGATTQISVMR